MLAGDRHSRAAGQQTGQHRALRDTPLFVPDRWRKLDCYREGGGCLGQAYAVVDDALSPDFPLGVELEVFIRREDAERFIEEVRNDDPELASHLRIEERELEAGGLN